MARRTFFPLFFLLSLAALFAGGVVAAAQTASGGDGFAHITLGQSAVPLFGPWKFTVGDSPIDSKTGHPLWAEPDFDDSQWETVDLTPKDGEANPISGILGSVPGWTAKGHPGYWATPGTASASRRRGSRARSWRLQDQPMWMTPTSSSTTAWLAGHFGDFTGGRPKTSYALPKMFALPEPISHEAIPARSESSSDGVRTGAVRVLAFRLWMEPFTLVNQPDAGGMHSAPVLGDRGAVAAGYQMQWLELIRAFASSAVLALLFGLLTVVAFSLILFDRSDRVYLWIGSLFLLLTLSSVLDIIANWTELQSIPVNQLLIDAVGALLWVVWIMVFWVWFGRQRAAWLPRLAAGIALLWFAAHLVRDEIFFGIVPHEVAAHFVKITLTLSLCSFGLLLWVVVEGIRRQELEGWLVLPMVVLRGMGAFTTQLSLLHIRMNWFPFGAAVNLATFANLLVAVVIALLLLRRLLQSVKRQRLMALDVKQAQEVQQLILPEARLALPGLTIESEYRPAREVGGDFFQIIPHKTDGSVLIVAGDVTGKGLKAGMLVALLVGAIRSTAETDSDPAGILAALNRRLLGRSDAQATCLALRIASDGTVTLVNAGHMAPYLNGEPLPMEGALPLGMFEGAESSVLHFQLKPGDKLILMSDGVAEATDADGKLFGFGRVHELLRTTRSATDVAVAAQAFGQDDDISVISVTRVAMREEAFA